MTFERTTRTLHLLEKDKKTAQDRIIILNKEIALVAYGLLQARIFTDEADALRANAILELGDAMVQMEMLEILRAPGLLLTILRQHALVIIGIYIFMILQIRLL